MIRALSHLKEAFTDQEVIHLKDHKRIVESLKCLKKIFDKHGIIFWLEGGTLIGAVRDGKIIPWDDDADITIWIKDACRLVDARKDFDKTEFEMYVIPVHMPTYGLGHYEIRDKKTKKHLICILFNYVAKRHMVRARFLPPISNAIRYFHIIKCDKLLKLSWKILLKFHLYKDHVVRYPMKCFGTPTTITFYGEEFMIPGNYDECLTHMYGDWRTPEKDNRGRNRKYLKDVNYEQAIEVE